VKYFQSIQTDICRIEIVDYWIIEQLVL